VYKDSLKLLTMKMKKKANQEPWVVFLLTSIQTRINYLMDFNMQSKKKTMMKM